MQTTKELPTYSYIYVLKIIACFLVIVNHTNSDIFLSISPSLTWFMSVTYFFVSKIAVPLFLMCSGVTLLEKTDSLQKYFLRISRIILVIIMFSSIYYIKSVGLLNFSLIGFINSIYSKNITGAFWYLYLYLGILIALPFLQKLCKVMSKTDFLHYIFISIIFLGTMPILTHYFPIFEYSSDLDFSLFTTSTGLFISGYFINKYFVYNKNYVTLSLLTFFLCTFLSTLGTYFVYIESSRRYLFFDNISFITITAPSIAIFYLAKCYFNFDNKIISFISKCTFGIYLISDYFIPAITSRLYKLNFITAMHPICSVIILEILVFLAGLIFTAILIKIPFFKKLIG
ncbi:MAG: acyltransferase family protein [Clostridia bacterium]